MVIKNKEILLLKTVQNFTDRNKRNINAPKNGTKLWNKSIQVDTFVLKLETISYTYTPKNGSKLFISEQD